MKVPKQTQIKRVHLMKKTHWETKEGARLKGIRTQKVMVATGNNINAYTYVFLRMAQ